jgi:hypothetical protein
MISHIIKGLGLAALFVAVYLIILFGSAFVPGLPMHEAWVRTGPMAAGPTDAQIRGWFENAAALVFFGSIVVPLLVGGVAGLLRLRGTPQSAGAWLTAIASWLTFYFLFVGVGAQEVLGAGAFLAVFGIFEYIGRRRRVVPATT